MRRKKVTEFYDIYILHNDSWYQFPSFDDKKIFLTEKLLKLTSYGRDSIFSERVNLRDIWKPFDISFETRYSGRKLKANPDICSYPHITILSEEAINLVKDLFPDYVEILPVNNIFSSKKYFFLNITSDIDCLTEKAETEGNLIITKVKRYDFDPEKIKNIHMFKIKKLSTEIFVSKEFVKRVIETKLKAFVFMPVWSLESGGIEYPAYSAIGGVDRTKNWIIT
jgi:hypothetical protein